MKTMKIILQNKLDAMIEGKKNLLEEVIDRIEDDARNLSDHIVPLGKDSPVGYHANGVFRADLNGKLLDIHNNALGQLCTNYGVPSQYANKLVDTEWGRGLLKNIFEEHNSNIARKRMLFRIIGDQVRGVLSDQYRRLDSRLIYGSFLKSARENGAVFVEACHTDVKSYMTVVYPQVECIPTENNGNIYSVFGARIVNSDFGTSSLSVSNFQMNVVCLNGMVGERAMRAVHLGKRLSPDLNLSQRTYELDSRTMASAVRDITSNMLDQDTILNTARQIRKASEKIIDMDNAIKTLPKEIYKSEVEGIRSILQAGDEDRGIVGKPTLWKLTSAITALSAELGGERKQELDSIAGKMIKI